MELEEKYIEKMKHAVGLDNKDPKKGVYEAYRNHSYYNKPQADWEYLRMWGLAIDTSKNKNEYVYSLTKKGFQELANATGLLIRYTIEVEPENHE